MPMHGNLILQESAEIDPVTLNIKKTHPHTRVEYKANMENMLSLKIAKTCHVCNELAVIIIVNDI